MSSIFISYASQDKLKAKVLAHALEEQGWTVWWDRRILPGQIFDEVISEALAAAKCVIVLWSKVSVTSDWVKEEATEAARRKILVPALIEDVQIPLGFRRIQAAQLISWYRKSSNEEFKQLLQSVTDILGVSSEHGPHKKTPPSQLLSQPTTSAWRAELISKRKGERNIKVYLSQTEHLVEFRYDSTKLWGNHIVKIDGDLVSQSGHLYKKNMKCDFHVADSIEKYPGSIEGVVSSFTHRIGPFRLSVAGRVLYEEE